MDDFLGTISVSFDLVSDSKFDLDELTNMLGIEPTSAGSTKSGSITSWSYKNKRPRRRAARY